MCAVEYPCVKQTCTILQVRFIWFTNELRNIKNLHVKISYNPIGYYPICIPFTSIFLYLAYFSLTLNSTSIPERYPQLAYVTVKSFVAISIKLYRFITSGRQSMVMGKDGLFFSSISYHHLCQYHLEDIHWNPISLKLTMILCWHVPHNLSIIDQSI